MPTQMKCTSCSTLLQLPDGLPPGRAVRCPKCATILRTPEQTPNEERLSPPPTPAEPRMPPVRPSAPRPSLPSSLSEEDETYTRPRLRKEKPKSKKGLLFGLLGCGGLLVLICGGVAVFGIYKGVQSIRNPEWKSFTSAEGRFTVEFPGVPTEGSSNSEGMVLHRFVAELPGGEVAYMVMYNELPPGAGIAGPHVLLEAVASKFGERVTSKKNIKIDSHTGMELEWTKIEGGQTWYLTDRIYLVGNRMYQVMVTTTKRRIDPISTARFLDSFRLNKPAR